MKIWDLSNGFNDTFLYIKFDITLLYIIEKGTCFCKCLFKLPKLHNQRRYAENHKYGGGERKNPPFVFFIQIFAF